MTDTPKDTSLQNYYYSGQIRHHLIQFMAIFGGLKVSTGKNDFNSDTNLIEVPIVMGPRDRVVSAILSENTQNKMLRLPTMSVHLSAMEIALDRMAGQGQERRETKLKRGGVIPDDLQSTRTLQGIPYRFTTDLHILTSNTQQMHECLEQILLLFNPILQIQISDVYGDRSKIVEVELTGININENFPAGNDVRIIDTVLNFSYVMYLSSPINYRNNIIKNIQIRLQEVNDLKNLPSDLNAGVNPFIITSDNWDAED